jgi:glycosyltransferase involved in cell wall biosynthesis
MKIACISPSTVPSRTANSIQVMKACHGLAQNGHEVRLFLPGEMRSNWDFLANQYGLETEFQLNWLPSRRIFRRYEFSINAVTQAQRWGTEVVYTWLPQAGLFALERGIPSILEVHDRLKGSLGPWVFGRFFRQRGHKRLAVITHALLKVLENENGIQPAAGEAVITPNGVEWERFANQPAPKEARAILGLRESPTAAFSGHFYAGRGTDLLFSLAQSLPDIQFLWIGGRQEDIDHWKSRLHAENVQNVVLTGFVENSRLPLHLAAADVLMIPFERIIRGSSGGNSADICSPMKLFEYMATGRAILTSDLPVIHEVLNETNASFAPPEDLPAWQKSLSALIKDPPLMRKLGDNAREDARQYSWKERERRALEAFPG